MSRSLTEPLIICWQVGPNLMLDKFEEYPARPDSQ